MMDRKKEGRPETELVSKLVSRI